MLAFPGARRYMKAAQRRRSRPGFMPERRALRPHRLEAQDTALSRRRRGFEPRWGRHFQSKSKNLGQHRGSSFESLSRPGAQAGATAWLDGKVELRAVRVLKVRDRHANKPYALLDGIGRADQKQTC